MSKATALWCQFFYYIFLKHLFVLDICMIKQCNWKTFTPTSKIDARLCDTSAQIEHVRFLLDEVWKGEMNNLVIGYREGTRQMEEPSQKCKESECPMSCISFIFLVSLLLKSLLFSGKIQGKLQNKQIALPRRLWVEKSVLGAFKGVCSSAFAFFSRFSS